MGSERNDIRAPHTPATAHRSDGLALRNALRTERGLDSFDELLLERRLVLALGRGDGDSVGCAVVADALH